MTEQYFTARGIAYRTNELVRGRTTLVFVHGVSGSSSAWKLYEEELGEAYNIVTYDQRGHGTSKRYSHYDDYALPAMAEDLHLLMQHVGDYPYVLVGHSFGAVVVLAYLSKWHERLRGAVLVSGDYNVGRHLPTKILRWLLSPIPLLSHLPLSLRQHGRVDYARFPNSGDWNAARSFTDIRTTGFRTYLYCIRQSYEMDATDVLPRLRIPVLLIHGTSDTIFGVENSVDMSRRMPNATLVTINGADHIAILNRPQEVLKALREFISAL